MVTLLLFVAALFKGFLCGKHIFCQLSLLALVSRLTIAIQIGYAKARSTAVFIVGKNKTETLGIGIYRRCSLEAGKDVIHEAKSRQIDKEYLTGQKGKLEASYTILSNTLTCALRVRLTVFKVAICVVQMEHIRAVNWDSGILRLECRSTQSITAICPGCSHFLSVVLCLSDPG
jgi:hypothetical protein